MSQNKGKAKTSPARKTGKSTASTAGIPKRATMNSRSPKKPTAISGDTMSNYAMYKRGGKIKRYQDAGPVKKPSIVATDEVKKNYEIPGREGAVKKMGEMFQDRVAGNTYPIHIDAMRPKLKKGGTTKAKKFAALAPPYDKATAADRIAGAKKNKKK